MRDNNKGNDGLKWGNVSQSQCFVRMFSHEDTSSDRGDCTTRCIFASSEVLCAAYLSQLTFSIL